MATAFPVEQSAMSSELAPTAVVSVTWRAVILSVVLTILSSYWIDRAEVVTFFTQITESVPALPAVAFLVALVVLNPLARRLWTRLALTRAEILVVYIFLTVATSMPGCGISRFFINTIPTLFYFDTPENDFANYQQYLPEWTVPHDKEIIRQLYEGAPTGAIPWAAWWKPTLAWGILFLLTWLLMMCITVVFRRQWAEKEKLTFPLLYLPLEATEGIDAGGLIGDFFRNRIMWIGFAIAALYNINNIAHAFNPGILTLGKFFDIGALFTEKPLSALRPLTLHYRPEMIGFGYLVSTEVSLSVWVFYLMLRLENLIAVTAGYEKSGFPFPQEQSLGAYIALALLLAWVARAHIADVVRRGFDKTARVFDADEPMSYRVAVIGGLLAFAGWVLWTAAAGMAIWVGILYLLLLMMVALVYTRIRAEVGVPLIWMFPYYQTYKGIKYFLGSAPLFVGGSWRTLTMFSTLVFFSRGYFPSLMGYQAEGFKLSRDAGVNQKHISWLLILAVIVGFYVGIWLHLRSYYEYGAGGLRGLEGWGAGIAKQEYTELTAYAKGQAPPDVPRIIATVSGFVFATALMLMRMVFLRFPLHPLAYCMATSYGDLVWGTFFIVWLVKALVFKLGGMRTYRRLIPGFIGLALGHFFTAGIVYSLLGAYGGEEWRKAGEKYGVWFG